LYIYIFFTMGAGLYWWGSLGPKVKGIVTYSLSPFEQKAFKGFISSGLPNLYKRFVGQVPNILPSLLGGYVLYTWAVSEHDRLLQKDVGHFEKLAAEADGK
jgi:ubiquinol-cytochrome c reductase subunit 8